MKKTGRVEPAALFEWLAALPERRDACLECGAGRAEVSAFMTRQFSRVIALDKTPEYLRGVAAPIEALCEKAEDLPFEENSLDLVVSLQALHHFDVPRHLAEAGRVLKKGGVFAAFCWGEMILPRDIATAYRGTFRALTPYWEKARPWLLSGYGGLAFEGERIRHPVAGLMRTISLRQLDLIIASWSAARRARDCGAGFPDPAFTSGSRCDKSQISVRWPLLGRVFRV